ncbi:MAG TPA: TetR/AcrR family transcriptional regulator [Pseudonocardia sp.]|nr:TetR/AcrR family transcriptional regulator [Pseudonocardia sp.]
MQSGEAPAKRRPGRPPASDSAGTEELILRTAREVFGEMGFAKTTFSEVAKRAGLTRPAVNHYFHSKRDLYNAVFESMQNNVVLAAETNAMKHDGLSERLSAFLETASQANSTDRSYARFVTTSLLDGFRQTEVQERAHAQLDDVRAFIRQVLEAGLVRGDVRSDLDIPAVTEMLLAVTWGISLYAGFVGTHEQLEAVIDQFSRLMRGVMW